MLWLKVFVWSVVLLDVGYCYSNRHTFADWEDNPIAASLGPSGAMIFRLATISAFALLVRLLSRQRRLWAWIFIAGIHAALLVQYVRLLV
jgi:hypothetical protein